MSKTFEIVPFHQHEILTVNENGEIIVPLKPLVDSTGMAWQGQLERVKRHPVLSKGIRVTLIPSQGGMQESVCLTLETLAGFLVTIQSDRIKEDSVRERVILFQTDAFRVLFDHYFGDTKRRTDAPAVPAGISEMIKILDAIKREPTAAGQDLLYRALGQVCSVRNLDLPPLAALLPAPARNDGEAAELLEQIDALVTRRPELNHHRQSDRIAVNRTELQAAGLPIERRLLDALRRHPRFISNRPVNNPSKRVIQCWVFLKAAPTP